MSTTEIAADGDIAALIRTARAQRRNVLSEPESKAFLRAHGIPVPPGMVIRDLCEAACALATVGPPVVVKAVAAALTHKSDAGAVVFPVETGAAAEVACRTIAARLAMHRPDIELSGFLIEAYRPAQPEWIVALRNDPSFGPTIMFGLGGLFVETLRQVSFRLAPLRDNDIAALLSEQPAMQLLAGGRGERPADRPGIAAVLRRLSDIAQLPEVVHEIADIEINPLVSGKEGVLALDALVVLRS